MDSKVSKQWLEKSGFLGGICLLVTVQKYGFMNSVFTAGWPLTGAAFQQRFHCIRSNLFQSDHIPPLVFCSHHAESDSSHSFPVKQKISYLIFHAQVIGKVIAQNKFHQMPSVIGC